MSTFTKIKLVIGLLFFSGVGAFLVWFQLKSRSDVGGPCSAAIDCAMDQGVEWCMKEDGAEEGFCARPCESAADCPAGLRCQALDVTQTTWSAGGNVDSRTYETNYCME